MADDGSGGNGRVDAPPSGPDPRGFGPDARALYAALVEHDGDLDLAREGLSRSRDGATDVDAALDMLTRLHLVHRAAAGDRVEAVSPSEAAEDLLGPREARAGASLADAAAMRRTMRELEPLYRKASRVQEGSSTAELLHDCEAVRSRLEEIRDGVTSTIYSAHPTMAPPTTFSSP